MYFHLATYKYTYAHDLCSYIFDYISIYIYIYGAYKPINDRVNSIKI